MNQQNVNALVNQIQLTQSKQKDLLQSMKQIRPTGKKLENLSFFGIPKDKLIEVSSDKKFDLQETPLGLISFGTMNNLNIFLSTVQLPFYKGITARFREKLFKIDDLDYQLGL